MDEGPLSHLCSHDVTKQGNTHLSAALNIFSALQFTNCVWILDFHSGNITTVVFERAHTSLARRIYEKLLFTWYDDYWWYFCMNNWVNKLILARLMMTVSHMRRGTHSQTPEPRKVDQRGRTSVAEGYSVEAVLRWFPSFPSLMSVLADSRWVTALKF